jgi:hypothetical protein
MAFRRAAPRSLIAATSAALLAVCAGALAGADAARAPTPVADRIVGLIQYVRWPGEPDLARWDVCVAAGGVAPAGSDLPPARGRPIAVRVLSAGESPERCQILDATGVPPGGVRALLERTRRMPVVTIGEGESFCTAGGIICLRPAGSGGGFEVNLSALQEAGLNANAQLLMLGRRRQAPGGAP